MSDSFFRVFHGPKSRVQLSHRLLPSAFSTILILLILLLPLSPLVFIPPSSSFSFPSLILAIHFHHHYFSPSSLFLTLCKLFQSFRSSTANPVPIDNRFGIRYPWNLPSLSSNSGIILSPQTLNLQKPRKLPSSNLFPPSSLSLSTSTTPVLPSLLYSSLSS